MKCRKCGKDAVGLSENSILGEGGIFSIHFYHTWDALCEEHLKEEEDRLRKI